MKSSQQFTIYLIRHAQPVAWSTAGLRPDLQPGQPLSSTGRMQASMAASFLAKDPPAVIYASPLDCTLQTAQVIAMQLGVPLAVDERLAQHRPGETNRAVVARIVRFWYERVLNAPPRCIALVSHDLPIRLILVALDKEMITDPALPRFDHDSITPHAGIWRARYFAEGHTYHWELNLIFRTLDTNANQQR